MVSYLTMWKPSSRDMAMSARRNVSASGREPFLTSEAACFAVDTATPFTLVQMSPIWKPAWAAPPCEATNATMGRARTAA